MSLESTLSYSNLAAADAGPGRGQSVADTHEKAGQAVKYEASPGDKDKAADCCDGKKDGKKRKFKTRDEAAKAAINDINQQSKSENREYGGMLYKNPDGSYGYTDPVVGSGRAVRPPDASIPEGTSVVGNYHTHADYSVIGPDQQPLRTGDPARDDYNSDYFSPGDRLSYEAMGALYPGFVGYLGTPSGTIKAFDLAKRGFPYVVE